MMIEDKRALRDAFGAFMTGVTVVTTLDGEGKPIGFTANSFTSVSLDPPLLLVCLAKTSRRYDAFTGAAGFAVNVLSEGQVEVSNTFARPVADRFSTVPWQAGQYGSPVFPESAAWFDCSMHKVIEAGDHAVLFGRVEAFSSTGRNGLGYVRGTYITPALEAASQALSGGAAVDVSAIAECDGGVLLVDAGDGRLKLPGVTVSEGNPADALADHLRQLTSTEVTVGFLFSVYVDRRSGRQQIVYRVRLDPAARDCGTLVDADAVPFDRLSNSQADIMLRRFAAERRVGAYGVYVGNEADGRVHPIGGGE